VEEDSVGKKVLNLLGGLGGDKGVPKSASKTKGVRGGPGPDFSKFFKPKALDSTEKSRYKSIFELLGQTLQIGKYARPEAESLKGSVAGPIARKVDESEGDKDKGDGGGFFSGIIKSIMKFGAIGIIAMAGALAILGLAIKEFTDIPWMSILKAGVVLGGLIAVGLIGIGGSIGFLLMAAGLVAIVGNEDGPGPKFKGPIKQLADVSWDTIGKAGVILGSLVAVGLVGIPGSLGFLIMAAGLIAIVGNEDGPGPKFKGPLKQLADINWETIGKAIALIGALGVAAFIMGLKSPFILAGALAIGALGIALVPFGFAAKLAAPFIEALAKPIDSLAGVLDKLANVPVQNLMLIGPALSGIGAGLVAMSGGNLIGAAMDKFGSFFLNDKGPIEKLVELGKAAPDIVKLGDAFDTISDFNFSDIDIEGDFNLAAVGVNNLTGSMDKLAISQQKVVGLFEQINSSAAALQNSGTSNINNTVKMDKELVDVNKQQVGLLAQIKDGIMMLVDKPASSNSQSLMQKTANKVKELGTTLDFNKSMGISDLIQ
jgi:hypothetical protein